MFSQRLQSWDQEARMTDYSGHLREHLSENESSSSSMFDSKPGLCKNVLESTSGSERILEPAPTVAASGPGYPHPQQQQQQACAETTLNSY
ncbi:hypothetical protein RhiJN_23979 [Ceratobasidium sp. AG-Ba]|nr:hypothetical protein RhiJN_23979 [Ceratobasidium sp. AG-Ba]